MLGNRPSLSCAAYALAVAIPSPIGVLIGIIIDAMTQGPMADWIFMISMGLACGVFIYMSINHLLAKGYTTKKMVRVDKPQVFGHVAWNWGYCCCDDQGHWKSTWTK